MISLRKLDPSNCGTIPKAVLIEALSGFDDCSSSERIVQILDDGLLENFSHTSSDEFDYRLD